MMTATNNGTEAYELPTGAALRSLFAAVRYNHETVDETLAANVIFSQVIKNSELFAACERNHRMMYSVLSYYARAAAAELTTPEDRNEFELVVMDCLYRTLV